MVELIPNFLSGENHAYLFKTLCGRGDSDQFYWLYSPNVTSFEDNNFYFGNTLIDRTTDNTYVSPFYHEIAGPILGRMNYNVITRVKCNLYTNMGVQKKHGYHVDFNFDHKVLLYSVNTCDGYTEFEDGEIIKSVANQAYIFDGKRKHQSVTQTDTDIRVNVNVVFH